MTNDSKPTLYRPSSGTEGACFIERWCASCQRDEGFRLGEGDSCTIVAATLVFGIDDPEYPREWIMGERGPVCTAWEPLPDDGVGRLEDVRQGELLHG
jgi:hypothetical protein